MDVRELPMFPLGSALLPHVVLPLHVFEPRYRVLVHDILGADGDGEFGVVLIERGHEVGGGEARFTVGCVARVLQAAELDDGRWALVTVGTERIEIVEWLDDDPYPRARVRALPDTGDPDPGIDIDDLEDRLHRVWGLRSELGEAAPEELPALPDDPEIAVWAVTALSALGPLDTYDVLVERDLGRRARVLADRLDGTIDQLAFLLP